MSERAQKALTALRYATTIAMLIFAPYSIAYAMMINASKGAGNFLGNKLYMRRLKKESKQYMRIRSKQDNNLEDNKVRIVGSLDDTLQAIEDKYMIRDGDDSYIMVKKGNKYSFSEVEKKEDLLFDILEDIRNDYFSIAGDPRAVGMLTKEYLIEYIRNTNLRDKDTIINNIDEILNLYEREGMIEAVELDDTLYILAQERKEKSLIKVGDRFEIVNNGIYTRRGERFKIDVPKRRFIVPEGKLNEVKNWLNEKFDGYVYTQDGIIPINEVEEEYIIYLPSRLRLEIDNNQLFRDAEGGERRGDRRSGGDRDGGSGGDRSGGEGGRDGSSGGDRRE